MRAGRAGTERARALRRTVTEAEKRLWSRLRQAQLGVSFRRQHPIPPYFADFACIEARLVIEADGGQHNLPGADVRRDAALRKAGWHVLRFWNNDILENTDGVIETIADFLRRGAPPPQPSPASGGGRDPLLSSSKEREGGGLG